MDYKENELVHWVEIIEEMENFILEKRDEYANRQ